MIHLAGLLFLVAIFASAAIAQSPFIDKMSLNMHLRTHRGQPEWRWTPKISFNVGGNLTDAAKLSLTITDPSGKPTIRLECSQYESGDIRWRTVSDCGNDLESEVASTATGVHGFEIKLAGTVLYSGKFTIGKYLFNPAKNPAFNKNFYYYVDYDWRLPVAFVGTVKDEYTPERLAFWLWIKADQSEPKATAQLIYKGRTVSETSFGGDMTYGAEENDAVDFTRLKFRFNALVEKPEAAYDWWRMYDNPGEYEVLVTRRGAVARIAKFTIGLDGRPVTSGVGKEIVEGHDMVVVPVKIEGTSDGSISTTLIKSGWWSNPISGM